MDLLKSYLFKNIFVSFIYANLQTNMHIHFNEGLYIPLNMYHLVFVGETKLCVLFFNLTSGEETWLLILMLYVAADVHLV